MPALLGDVVDGGGGTDERCRAAAEPPDDGLLEFLGSVDSEDKDWHDYLARTDIDKVARVRAGNPPTGTPRAQAGRLRNAARPAGKPATSGTPVEPP